MACHIARQSFKTRPPRPEPELRNMVLIDTSHEDEYNDYVKNKQFIQKEIKEEQTPSTDLIEPPSSKRPRTSLTKGRQRIVLLDPSTPIERFGDERSSFLWSAHTLLICLVICAILQGAIAIASIAVWFNLYFKLPLAFVTGFHPLSYLFENKWIALIATFEPFYHLVLLIAWVLILGRKRPYLTRLFCWISVWIVILLCVVTANCIYFLTSITIKKINEKLKQALELCFKDPPDKLARESWNELQYYLQCCGIFDYHDWTHLNGSEGVPRSCCRSRTICEESEDFDVTQNVWPVGCSMRTFDLFNDAGHAVLIVAILAIIVGAITTYFARLWYMSAKRKDDRKFKYHTVKLLADVFCCGFCTKLCSSKCCQRQKKINPYPRPNPIYPQESSLHLKKSRCLADINAPASMCFMKTRTTMADENNTNGSN